MVENPIQIRLGTTNCYALSGSEGFLLVDAGSISNKPIILAALREAGLAPSDIKLVVITHAHFDHTRGLRTIVDASGAPVICHRLESSLLENGRIVMPPGTSWKGKVAHAISKFILPMLHLPSVSPTILVDGPYSLEPFGFAARILPTPGHFIGSISVIAEESLALVGDLCINGVGKNQKSFFPVFADNVDDLVCSWQKLLETDIDMIYPSHGRPFAAQQLRAALSVC